MNYLAHAALAEPTASARLGSLLGDFGRGLELERFNDTVRFAVLEHRALDAHFDALDGVRALKPLFPEHLSRFSGILIDVFFDYALVNEWDAVRAEGVELPAIGDVTSSLYGALEAEAALLPPRLRRTAPHIVEHDWLGGYGRLENVGRALGGIASRMRRDVPLEEGLDVLRRNEAVFRSAAVALIPELDRWLRARRERLGRG